MFCLKIIKYIEINENGFVKSKLKEINTRIEELPLFNYEPQKQLILDNLKTDIIGNDFFVLFSSETFSEIEIKFENWIDNKTRQFKKPIYIFRGNNLLIQPFISKNNSLSTLEGKSSLAKAIATDGKPSYSCIDILNNIPENILEYDVIILNEYSKILKENIVYRLDTRLVEPIIVDFNNYFVGNK